MPHPSWLESVEGELIVRGVPRRQRHRLAAEWRDHIHDLMDEGFAMTAIETKLGDVNEVAAGAAEQYQRSRWARRHPLLAFGLLPMPLVLMAFLGVALGISLPFAGAELANGEDLSRPVRVAWAFTCLYAVSFLPFMLTAAWYTRLARRTGIAWGWAALALAQVLLLSAVLVPTLIYSDVPGQSMMYIAIVGLSPPRIFVGWGQVSQVVVAAAAAGLIWWATRRRELMVV